MTSEETPDITPQPIAVDPGYQTTEFWLVAGWTLFAGLAVSRGWFTQAQAEGANAFVSANNVLIASVLGALWHYLTSRGKLKSNAVKAAAAAQIQSALGWKDIARMGTAIAPSLLPGKAGQIAGKAGAALGDYDDDWTRRQIEKLAAGMRDNEHRIEKLDKRLNALADEMEGK